MKVVPRELYVALRPLQRKDEGRFYFVPPAAAQNKNQDGARTPRAPAGALPLQPGRY